VIAFVIGGLYHLYFMLTEPERKTEYDADFARASDVLSKKNQGFAFGNVSLDLFSSFRGALIYGASGAGKNVAILVPSILRMAGPSNLIIHDPSRQLWELCSGYLKSIGYRVVVLDYLNGLVGGFNPLRGLHVNSISEIQKICKLLIHISLGQSKEAFWNLSAENCLKVLIQIVLSQPIEMRSMRNVLLLCNQFAHSPSSLDLLVVKSNDSTLLSEYRVLLTMDVKMRASIIATVRAALNLWADPQVALATAYDSMEMDTWRTEKVCVFVNSSTPSMAYYSPLTNLFFEHCFAKVMERIPSASERPIFFLIDECSSLYLSMDLIYSNFRKYKCGCLSVLQSPHQLFSIYGNKSKGVEDNAYAKLFMAGGIDLQIATMIEQMLGKFEYELPDKPGVRHIRSLNTATQVRESKECYLFTGNNRAIKLNPVPYFKQSGLLKKTKIPPGISQSVPPFTEPPSMIFHEA